MIATAEHYIYYTSYPSGAGNYTAGYQVSVLDVNSGQMLYNQMSMDNVPNDSLSESTPRDMVYVKHKMALMIVDEYPYINNYGVLCLDPFATTFYMPQYYYYISYSDTEHYQPTLSFYSVAELPWVGCVVSGGKNWIVLDFNNLPALFGTTNCIGTFMKDFFPCTLNEPEQDVSGQIISYNMTFETVSKVVEQSRFTNC